MNISSKSLTRRFWENIMLKQSFLTQNTTSYSGNSFYSGFTPSIFLMNIHEVITSNYRTKVEYCDTHTCCSNSPDVCYTISLKWTDGISSVYKGRSYDIFIRVNYSNKFCNIANPSIPPERKFPFLKIKERKLFFFLKFYTEWNIKPQNSDLSPFYNKCTIILETWGLV